MKYKDLGNMLSKEELKSIKGGFIKPVCNLGVECRARTTDYGGIYTYAGTCQYHINACNCVATGPEGTIYDSTNPTCNQLVN